MSHDIITYDLPAFCELINKGASDFGLLGFVQQMIGGRIAAEDFRLTSIIDGFEMSSSLFSWLSFNHSNKKVFQSLLSLEGAKRVLRP